MFLELLGKRDNKLNKTLKIRLSYRVIGLVGSRVETKISLRLGFFLYAITGRAIIDFFITVCRCKYSFFIILLMSMLRRL